MGCGQLKSLGFPQQDGNLAKVATVSLQSPWNFKNWCYLQESLANPRALARQLHPGSTFGFIRGVCHQAGSGEVGLAVSARHTCCPGWPGLPCGPGGPCNEQSMQGARGGLGGPFTERGPILPWERKGAGGVAVPTLLPTVQVGERRPGQGVALHSCQVFCTEN